MVKALQVIASALGVLVLAVAVIAVGLWLTLRKPDIPFEELKQRYGDARGAWLDVGDGLRIHHRVEGREGGQTLVLVHGFTASVHTWEPWVRELGDAYRIVSVDLPGHGLSPAPADFRPSPDAYAEVLEAFAAKKGLTRFVLVGQSMGGDVAWRYTLKHPDRVEALVLVGSAGWPDPRGGERLESPMARALRTDWGRLILRDLDASSAFRQGLKASFADPKLADEAMVTRYVELNRAPGARETVLRLMEGWDDKTFATPEALAAVRAPTLVLHGRKDALVPAEHGERFAEAVPGAKLVVYEDVGHILNEEIPARSAEDLHRFLDALKPPAAPRPRAASATAPAGSPYFFQ